jgi:hypothetical protein
MSALLSAPTGGENDPGARLERVKLLREHRGFQWFLAKITARRDAAQSTALNKASTTEIREKALTEYWALLDVIDILDSEERAAAAALKQKHTKE